MYAIWRKTIKRQSPNGFPFRVILRVLMVEKKKMLYMYLQFCIHLAKISRESVDNSLFTALHRLVVYLFICFSPPPPLVIYFGLLRRFSTTKRNFQIYNCKFIAKTDWFISEFRLLYTMILAVKEFKVQSPTKIVFLIFTSNLSRMVNSVEYAVTLDLERMLWDCATLRENFQKYFFTEIKNS